MARSPASVGASSTPVTVQTAEAGVLAEPSNTS
jgi:hypothetical protein